MRTSTVTEMQLFSFHEYAYIVVGKGLLTPLKFYSTPTTVIKYLLEHMLCFNRLCCIRGTETKVNYFAVYI